MHAQLASAWHSSLYHTQLLVWSVLRCPAVMLGVFGYVLSHELPGVLRHYVCGELFVVRRSANTCIASQHACLPLHACLRSLGRLHMQQISRTSSLDAACRLAKGALWLWAQWAMAQAHARSLPFRVWTQHTLLLVDEAMSTFALVAGLALASFITFLMDGPAALLIGALNMQVVPSFDKPWFATSVTDFWGRWVLLSNTPFDGLVHMSQ